MGGQFQEFNPKTAKLVGIDQFAWLSVFIIVFVSERSVAQSIPTLCYISHRLLEQRETNSLVQKTFSLSKDVLTASIVY